MIVNLVGILKSIPVLEIRNDEGFGTPVKDRLVKLAIEEVQRRENTHVV
jgi:hypothetical protein